MEKYLKGWRRNVLIAAVIVFYISVGIYMVVTYDCDDSPQRQIECAENLRRNLNTPGRPSLW